VISVIIEASDDAAALARRLTELVPAAAEGLVREVLVRGAAGQALAVVEDAGATVLAAGDDAAARGRGDWLLMLPLGGALRRDWMDAIGAHIGATRARPARLIGKRGPFGWGFGPEGWLSPRSAGAVEKDLQRLARLGGRRLRVFDRR